MYKKIWLPLAAFAIVGCSSDLSSDTKENNISSHRIMEEPTIKDWAFSHNVTSIKMSEILLLQIENGYDSEGVLAKLSDAKNEDETKSILVNSGLDSEIANELISLANDIKENMNKFYQTNPDFKRLSPTQQAEQLSNAVDDSFNSGEITFPVYPEDPIQTEGCYETYRKEMDRCLQDCAKKGTFELVMGLVFERPEAVAAIIYTIVEGNECQDRAKADYRDCLAG